VVVAAARGDQGLKGIVVAEAAGVSEENVELRIAAQLGELVNWTRRIFWLLLIVLVIEAILMAVLLPP
jgi:hypothetical protein